MSQEATETPTIGRWVVARSAVARVFARQRSKGRRSDERMHAQGGIDVSWWEAFAARLISPSQKVILDELQTVGCWIEEDALRQLVQKKGLRPQRLEHHLKVLGSFGAIEVKGGRGQSVRYRLAEKPGKPNAHR